jgi:hypothetical protein
MANKIAWAGVPLVALVVALAPAASSSASLFRAPATAALPLPQDRLHFGLANDPSDLAWMTNSGVPWRYRYQYLAGGVNTGKGWETWNSPAGAFASYYMKASGDSGYIPVLTYYELLQSNPSTGISESDRDYSNLNNTATMAAYYANFKLLMQMTGAYAKPVIVHVEPDLWGYLQQRAGAGDASAVSASVASSGFPEAAGIPNTAQGFGYALLKLRDLYGANAILAIHASAWANGTDIASTTSTSVNAVAVADSTAAFLGSAGITSNPYGTTWDLVFNDLDDHDAAWWEKQGVINSSYTHWWDPTNTTFPNFSRYLAWVAELKARTGRPQMAWQVPVGNQYFLTMNNTCGHFQDNVAQYFISHPADLFAAGLIAVLFGAGNDCQTTYSFARGEAATNNNGLPTTDLLGYCNACNTHVAAWPDHDGGYLRLFVGMYYLGWQSLGGILTAGPGSSSWGTGRADVFVRGTDNGLWQNTANGTSWSGWSPLGGGLTSDPGAVSWGPNRIDVFVRGTDDQLWHKWYSGTSWYQWEPLGGGLTSGPGVASWGYNRLDVFVRGTDNQLWHRWWDGIAWRAWEPLGGALTSNPTAVSWGPNRIDVFVRGTDNQLWHRWWDGIAWRAWEPLGGILTSSPGVASCTSGHLDVYAIGNDGGLWHNGLSTSWSGWQPLGGQFTSSPSSVCRPGTTSVDLFERGIDSALWRTSVTGS